MNPYSGTIEARGVGVEVGNTQSCHYSIGQGGIAQLERRGDTEPKSIVQHAQAVRPIATTTTPWCSTASIS
jgi:hypothetical protein